MTEPSTSFAQQEILARLEPGKGELIYVAKNNFQWCGSRSARRFEKGTCTRPGSVISMGGYYTARTQRVDMLD